jgi:hypothetical protein
MKFRMSLGLSLMIALVFPSAVFGGPEQQMSPVSETAFVAGILDRVTLSESAGDISGGNPEPVAYTWQCGDRKYPQAGRDLKATDPPLTFSFQVPKPGTKLTVELREFRRTNDGRVAYLVEANGQQLQFRNRKFEGASPSSAFVDIPENLATAGTLTIRLTNLCDNPICFSSAILYDDLEGYTRREGLLQPMYVGPTVDHLIGDREKMKRIRDILPDTPEVKPMFCLCSLPVAGCSPEQVANRLDQVIAASRDLNMKAEIQVITWWAGTPGGCDGLGGHWNDVTYQQVTYVPSTGRFGLSIPNCWSNTPWLTIGNPRFNAFKAESFARFGRILRDCYDRDPVNFPVFSIVLDNEPTYWAAGNPGAAPDQLADFNLAMVETARKQDVTLDPRDGLSPEEIAFLRRSLLDYNREMNAGIRRGLGDGPLAERVFTHTFLATVNGLFTDNLQATGIGVIRDGRMGGEWFPNLDLLPILEQHRELGIPSGINWELGGNGSAIRDFPITYAMGCDHITLFNVAEDRLAELAPSLKAGWTELKPAAWRKTLFSTDRFRIGEASLKKYFVETQGVATELWPGRTYGIFGKESGKSSHALMHFTSRELTGTPVFSRISLKYDARAFVFDHSKGGSTDNPDGYLAVRAGTSRDKLTEVDRMFNSVKQAGDRIDLSRIANGAPELWVEFEFHPIGMAGWVSLFDVELEQPWTEENLLYTNRSYHADRLRCESAIVGWRADALWALARADEDAAKWPPADPDRAGLKAASELFAAGSFQKAYCAVRKIIDQLASAPETKPWAPASNRQERGELGGADAANISFNPYDTGYCHAVVKVAPDVKISLEENGVLRPQASATDLLPGDDVTIEVKDNQAVAVCAKRGSASGKVATCSAMTPFAMPVLALEGQPGHPFSYAAKIATGDAFKGWAVGSQPAQVGDVASIRWNPETGRIVAAEMK